MSDKPQSVYTVTERNGREFWTRIGAAFVNANSITVQLDALPVSGRLVIREDREREQREDAPRGR